MSKDNFLFAIIGLLLGFILGFMLHGVMSEREMSNRAGAASSQQGLPPNHPPVAGDQAGDPQQVFAQVQEAMKQAREQPNNFEAQVTAAKLEYQVRRYDQAVEYLLKANQLRPDNSDVLAMLGEANMDGEHYDAAEKWYRAALLKRPDDLSSLDGLCNVLLAKGDAKAAEKAINMLEKIDPTISDLPQFRDRLAKLKSSGK